VILDKNGEDMPSIILCVPMETTHPPPIFPIEAPCSKCGRSRTTGTFVVVSSCFAARKPQGDRSLAFDEKTVQSYTDA